MFANETIGGFKYLSSNDKSHRLTLLKHEMAIDYILAKTGGLCATLNFTERPKAEKLATQTLYGTVPDP